MGHERIGFLPKTKQWNAIVSHLAEYDGDSDVVFSIASETLDSVKRTYELMPQDESLIKAIEFLSALSCSATKENQVDFLNEMGYPIGSNLSLYSILSSAKDYIDTETGSLETNKITKDAVMQALSTYQQNNANEQLSLYGEESSNVWKQVGNGAAFCELTRSFFAAFTDRYLKYYIERAAASQIDDFGTLQSFTQTLTNQTDAISHHAFETSQIMQSFAAGWFNNHAKNAMPSQNEISGFLQVAFGKMKEEFRREADGA